MIAEVVSVGTELLLGEIVNSNAAVIGRRLADTGYDSLLQVTVGDNLERIAEVLVTACDRSDVVVVTGGIGPTQDDVTKEALCLAAGLELSRDTGHAEAIRRELAGRGRVVRDSVLRMADVPVGAEVLPNGNGFALGVALQCRGARVYVLPGVPAEMELMLDEHVVPRLRALSGGGALRSTVVRTRGVGESEVAHRLDALFASENPSIAFRITTDGVLVRITAKAASRVAADEMLVAMETRVREILADVLG